MPGFEALVVAAGPDGGGVPKGWIELTALLVGVALVVGIRVARSRR